MQDEAALKKFAEGHSVWCPGLPGCWSEGSTEAEALDGIRDAIKEYLAAAREPAGEGERREIDLTI